MSDALTELLAHVQQLEPERLYEALLRMQERRLDEPSPKADAPEAEAPSFDELDAWRRARRIRMHDDTQRLRALLEREDEGAPRHTSPPSPVGLLVSIRDGRAHATVRLRNDTPWPLRVHVVPGHATADDGSLVPVELHGSPPQMALGAGEEQTMELALVLGSAPPRRLVLPLELREPGGEGTVLARLWVEGSCAKLPDEPVPLVSLGRDPSAWLGALERLRRAVLLHPEASRALYAALIAEGRRFARTEAGRTWASHLARSPKMRRIRLAWEVLSLSTLDGAERSETLLSTWMDALHALVGRSDMEELLGALSSNEGIER